MRFFKNRHQSKPLALKQSSYKFGLEHKNVDKWPAKESFKEIVTDFGMKSTIHGMKRIFQEISNIYERFFWVLVLIFAILGSVFVCIILSERFNEGTFETVVESTNFPVFQIPFAEVVICNVNRLNWIRLDEAKRVFLPHEKNLEKIRLFETVIGLYDNISFGQFEHFSSLAGQPIELVNNINFSSVFDLMTWRCEELLTDCSWRYIKLNCCDIFERVRGLDGLCWHFNTLSTNKGRHRHLIDKMYPLKTGNVGPKSGLSVRVLLNEKKQYRRANKKGILVTALRPGNFHMDPYFVPTNTETAVIIEPVAFFFDSDTRSISVLKRKCVFIDEIVYYGSLSGLNYTLQNCYVHCRQEYLLKLCNCTVDIMFPQANNTVCKVEDFLCLAKNNDYFRSIHKFGEENFVRSNNRGMMCECYPNCVSYRYMPDISPSFIPSNIGNNTDYVDLDVHYRTNTMMVYRTSLAFDWVDLLVSFGGVVSLFLGCSLISLLELVYFLLIEIPIFSFTNLRSEDKRMNTNNEQDNLQQYNQLPLKRRNYGFNNRIMATDNWKNNKLSMYNKKSNIQHMAMQRWLPPTNHLTNKH